MGDFSDSVRETEAYIRERDIWHVLLDSIYNDNPEDEMKIDDLVATYERLHTDSRNEPTFGQVIAAYKEEQEGYVRVQFASRGTVYIYACNEQAQVGDYVVVPGSYVAKEPKVLKVIGKGRNGYKGPCKVAYLIPPHFTYGNG